MKDPIRLFRGHCWSSAMSLSGLGWTVLVLMKTRFASEGVLLFRLKRSFWFLGQIRSDCPPSCGSSPSAFNGPVEAQNNKNVSTSTTSQKTKRRSGSNPTIKSVQSTAHRVSPIPSHTQSPFFQLTGNPHLATPFALLFQCDLTQDAVVLRFHLNGPRIRLSLFIFTSTPHRNPAVDVSGFIFFFWFNNR